MDYQNYEAGEQQVSLYNIVNGFNMACLLYLPMLGKHSDEYPRFRDCFISDPDHPKYDNHIHVYTRTGGANRQHHIEENRVMMTAPEFVATFDDKFDSTFASFVYKIPEKWQADFNAISEQRFDLTSEEYRAEMKRVFPKLTEVIDSLFKHAQEQAPESH